MTRSVAALKQAIEEESNESHCIKIYVQKIWGDRTGVDRNGNPYNELHIRFRTDEDKQYRDRSIPIFCPEARKIINTLQERCWFSLTVEKREGDKYPGWHNIVEVKS